jgi:hypothetical protein
MPPPSRGPNATPPTPSAAEVVTEYLTAYLSGNIPKGGRLRLPRPTDREHRHQGRLLRRGRSQSEVHTQFCHPAAVGERRRGLNPVPDRRQHAFGQRVDADARMAHNRLRSDRLQRHAVRYRRTSCPAPGRRTHCSGGMKHAAALAGSGWRRTHRLAHGSTPNPRPSQDSGRAAVGLACCSASHNQNG